MYAGDKVDQRGLLADETGGAGVPRDYQTIQKEQAPPKRGCRDPIFLLLFLAHLALVGWVAFTYGVDALQVQPDTPPGESPPPQSTKEQNLHVLLACGGLAIVAGLLSGSWMTFMISRAQDLIQCMLLTVVIANIGAAGLGLIAGQFVLAIFGLLSAAVSYCYLRAVQPYIPFASAQLRAATCAIRSFFSVVYVAYASILVALGWCVVWALAMAGVINYYRNTAPPDNDNQDEGSPDGAYYFLLLVSFYWTLQVIGGVVNCTVAGVVGTWWYLSSSEQKNVVGGSLGRASSTSLGSICLGSLIVAVLEALRTLVEKSREQKDGVGKCLADCLLSCLDSMARYFNRWAFIYVGIYGYSFTEAGSRVFDLFHRKGLMAIINDQLISRVLFLGALMVGLVTCGLGLIVGAFSGQWLSGVENAAALLGGAGFLVGLFVCDVMMNVVSSAVAAVLVCFVEDPSALQYTHPEYHTLLAGAWGARFPAISF